MYLTPDLFDGRVNGPKKYPSHLSNARSMTLEINGISYLLDGFPILLHTSLGRVGH